MNPTPNDIRCALNTEAVSYALAEAANAIECVAAKWRTEGGEAAEVAAEALSRRARALWDEASELMADCAQTLEAAQ